MSLPVIVSSLGRDNPYKISIINSFVWLLNKHDTRLHNKSTLLSAFWWWRVGREHKHRLFNIKVEAGRCLKFQACFSLLFFEPFPILIKMLIQWQMSQSVMTIKCRNSFSFNAAPLISENQYYSRVLLLMWIKRSDDTLLITQVFKSHKWRCFLKGFIAIGLVYFHPLWQLFFSTWLAIKYKK